MLESLFNKVTGLQACNFTKKRLQHRRFPVNIANFKNTYFEKHLRTAGSDSSYILHRKLNKIIQEADWPSRLAFCFFWNIKSLYFTYSHSYSFVLSLAVMSFAVTHCHFLLLVVIRCHSLSFFATYCTTRCHSFSLVVILCTARCHSLYRSLSFVVPLVVIRCHSLSFVVPLIVNRCHSLSFVFTRCTIRLSFHKRSFNRIEILELNNRQYAFIKKPVSEIISANYRIGSCVFAFSSELATALGLVSSFLILNMFFRYSRRPGGTFYHNK